MDRVGLGEVLVEDVVKVGELEHLGKVLVAALSDLFRVI